MLFRSRRIGVGAAPRCTTVRAGAASTCSLCTRRILGGASEGRRPDDAWTLAPEKKTRKLADGRFALSRSNSSHMWASSWSQVTDTSTPSSSRCGTWPRTPYSRRQTLPASPPAPGTRPREGRRLPDRAVRTAGQEAAAVAAHHPHARGAALLRDAGRFFCRRHRSRDCASARSRVGV